MFPSFQRFVVQAVAVLLVTGGLASSLQAQPPDTEKAAPEGPDFSQMLGYGDAPMPVTKIAGPEEAKEVAKLISQTLATGHTDGTIKLWGKDFATMQAHTRQMFPGWAQDRFGTRGYEANVTDLVLKQAKYPTFHGIFS